MVEILFGTEADLNELVTQGSVVPMSKRRRGYPSGVRVRVGGNITRYGEGFVEKLGRNDPCPCRSGKSFRGCHLKDPNSSWQVGDDYKR